MPVPRTVLLGADDVRRAVSRIAHEIVERDRDLSAIAIIGIRSRGDVLASRLREAIRTHENATVPLGSLDPMIRAELRADLREIFRVLGQTVVLVTHDLAEAEFFADRVVLLRDGRVVQEGRLLELVERPADPFVTRFISAQSRPGAPG